jgi:hypothetical protein
MNKELERNDVVEKLIKIINEEKVLTEEIPYIISSFMYSIGYHLSSNPPKNEEEILLRYAENPTLDSALMAQALYMQETWKVNKGKANNDKDVSRKTKRRKAPVTI